MTDDDVKIVLSEELLLRGTSVLRDVHRRYVRAVNDATPSMLITVDETAVLLSMASLWLSTHE